MSEGTKLIDEKSKSISRGAYWFGIIGRILIVFGSLDLINGLLAISGQFSGPPATTVINTPGIENFASAVMTLMTGWLFLLARDSFEAINYLLNESKDTI